jgi:uridine phosphorylase
MSHSSTPNSNTASKNSSGLQESGLKPHIKLQASQITDAAIVCGDPARAAKIASMMSDAQPLAANREYHSYRGTHEGKPIMVISHGVGSAGAAICFQELLDLGVKRVIRVGTAGGLQKNSKVAGLVIANAAARKDGVTAAMVPGGYPAVADFSLSNALFVRAKEEKSLPSVEQGLVLTSDLFYPGLMDDELKLYSAAGVRAVEMEISTLYTIAALKNVRAAAIVVLDGNPLYWSEGVYAPGSDEVKRSTDVAIRCALDVLALDETPNDAHS